MPRRCAKLDTVGMAAPANWLKIGVLCAQAGGTNLALRVNEVTDPIARAGERGKTVSGGIYTAVSGMRAQMDALDILSNNLANINTAGYKEEKAFFTILRQEAGTSGQNQIGEVADRLKVIAESAMNPVSGSLALTNRDLDIALTGNGYLAVETPQGVRYTRNGSLVLNSRSELATADGFPVLSESGRPISLGSGSIRFAEDGDVYLEKVKVDRLKIVSFDKTSPLVREGNSLFSCQGGKSAERPSDSSIKQGFLEQSNVNPVSAVVSMVGILRNFEAMQKSVNLVMNDIDSKSIEKLGR